MCRMRMLQKEGSAGDGGIFPCSAEALSTHCSHWCRTTVQTNAWARVDCHCNRGPQYNRLIRDIDPKSRSIRIGFLVPEGTTAKNYNRLINRKDGFCHFYVGFIYQWRRKRLILMNHHRFTRSLLKLSAW